MKQQSITKWGRFSRMLTVWSIVMLVAISWITLDSWMHLTDRDGVRTVQIPNFCGMEATSLSFAEWQEVSVVYQHNHTVPSGTVISQSPAAGSFRKLSHERTTCHVELVVSLGREYVALPTLVGEDVRAAMQTLQSLGLSVTTQTVQEPNRAGEVLSMEPHAGTQVPHGSTVTLTVGAEMPSETVEVPDVRGLSRADALIRLWLSGLEVSSVSEEGSSASEGTVIRQSHQPGTVVRVGTKIKLFISKEDTQE